MTKRLVDGESRCAMRKGVGSEECQRCKYCGAVTVVTTKKEKKTYIFCNHVKKSARTENAPKGQNRGVLPRNRLLMGGF